MKNEQLKDQAFPDRTDPHRPIFSWAKTALIGDDFIIWWLFYGNALGKETLCHRVFRPKNEPLDQRRRVALSWSLRSSKRQLRDEWRKLYPEVNALDFTGPEQVLSVIAAKLRQSPSLQGIPVHVTRPMTLGDRVPRIAIETTMGSASEPAIDVQASEVNNV